jgi:hypothetical protein
LMIAALVAPLIGLAWWKRIDPHPPLLILRFRCQRRPGIAC